MLYLTRQAVLLLLTALSLSACIQQSIDIHMNPNATTPAKQTNTENQAAPQPVQGSECPEYTFPLAEPPYTNKVARDFSAFESALAAFPPERASELDLALTNATIPEIQDQLSSGALTSAELVTYYVDRIRRYDIGKLNSVMTLNPETLAIAAALDAERAAGSVRGPMHGIPVLIKDNIATGDGMPTTAGAYALRNWLPSRDAFLVRRLREAGAIILGKANLSEFANYVDQCMPNGFSTLGGQTRNPHGPYDPSGSSSGSAVAVAANLVPVSVGTETQGSIIMPAWANGVYGLKTSRGLVSRDFIVPLLEAQDVPGPFARNATDLAIVLTVMAGVDANDPATAAAASLDGFDFLQYATNTPAASVRVGVPTFLPGSAGSEAASAEQVTDVLDRAGLTVVPIEATAISSLPTTDLGAILPLGFRTNFDHFMQSLGSDAPVASLADVARMNAEDPANRVPYNQRSIVGAVEATMSYAELDSAVIANREATQTSIDELMEKYKIDVLYFPQGQQYSAAGYPALSVPNGLDEMGRPQSMIFTGGFLSEPSLLTVAYTLEQANGGRPIPVLP